MVKCSIADPKSVSKTQDVLRKTDLKPDFMLDHGQQNDRGFHLQGTAFNECRDQDSMLSGSLIYKQRIDAMFDETRSLMSGCNGVKMQPNYPIPKKATSLIETNHKYYTDYNIIGKVTNNVQVKIEKMFADISSSSEQEGDAPSKGVGTCNRYPVDYLGSIPLQDKVNSLEGLQEPLKKLYFSYKQSGKKNPVLQGSLEISSSGLKVSHSEERGKAVLEQLNPFPTIAVWAAVKFVCRPRGLGHGKEFGLDYAFLPLIAGPDGADKITLFRRLNYNETLHFIDENYDDQSPLFAVVMRKIGTSRQLECHGFICSSTEHAIVMAADLYKALVISMAQNREGKNVMGKRNKLEYKNGLSTVRSVGGSSEAGESEYILPQAYNIMMNHTNVIRKLSFERLVKTKIPPVRPPRRIKSRSSTIISKSSDSNIYTKEADKNIYRPKYSMQHKESELCTITSESASDSKDEQDKNYSSQTPTKSNIVMNRPHYNMNAKFVQRSLSERLQCMQPAQETKEVGDILTKVAIPRSRSFLNAGGPLSSRYNRHYIDYSNNNAVDARKKSIGSPLGLNELFNEFRLQEGLNNMDDILEAIIDEEGMSFNDLKPIYKEFLLKLAVTLTKDELYQHSKSIMQRQKHRKQQLLRRKSCKLRKTFTANGGLKRVFRKSVSKLKTSKNKASSFEFTSILFPSCGNSRSKQIRDSNKHSEFVYTTSSSASSILVTKLKPKRTMLNRHKSLKRSEYRRSYQLNNTQDGKRVEGYNQNIHDRMLSKPSNTSTSEDSDFFRLIPCGVTGKGNEINSKTPEHCNHQSSSGYFSCSECSYNSESCTCTSADKCYCSLGKRKKPQKNDAPSNNSGASNKINSVSLSSCGCDTDSCFESEKCYCNKNKQTTIFDQLKQQGFVASESSLSRANSPTTAWQNNESIINESKRKCSKRNKDGLQSSKSLEFLQIHRHPDTVQRAPWNLTTDSGRIPSRMDVYEVVPRHQPLCRSSFSYSSEYTSSRPLPNSGAHQRRSYSSDNLALDYEMFTNNAKSDEEAQQYQQRKVLVVSARDPRGRVIYMGASCRSCSPKQYGKVPLAESHHQNSAMADEAFSVKKSAEIAAIFSDVKSDRNTNLICNYGKEDVIYNTLEPPDYYLMKGRIGSSSYIRSTNLENSLGYFP